MALEQRYGRVILEDVNKSMKRVQDARDEYSLEVEELVEYERPPMAALTQYQQAHTQPA